jgi:hypothetical protein
VTKSKHNQQTLHSPAVGHSGQISRKGCGRAARPATDAARDPRKLPRLLAARSVAAQRSNLVYQASMKLLRAIPRHVVRIALGKLGALVRILGATSRWTNVLGSGKGTFSYGFNVDKAGREIHHWLLERDGRDSTANYRRPESHWKVRVSTYTSRPISTSLHVEMKRLSRAPRISETISNPSQ